MNFSANSEHPLALDPYGPATPTPDRADSKWDPLALDPYSPIVGHIHHADRDGQEVEGHAGDRTR
jgi:hypothetical protein